MATKSKHTPLPEELLVYYGEEGTADEYLDANKTMVEAAEQLESGEVRRVGRYVLQEVVDVSQTLITTAVKAPKRKAKTG